LRQLLGNQFDRGAASDIHVPHTALDQVIGHL